MHLYTIDGKLTKKFHDSGRILQEFLKKVLGKDEKVCYNRDLQERQLRQGLFALLLQNDWKNAVTRKIMIKAEILRFV